MLRELSVENFALIEQLHIEFTAGLNVLTGETGAGKSIIIDAVALLLGERASQTYIRTGADAAVVRGLFETTHLPEVKTLLSEMGLSRDEEDNLLLSREISAAGKNTCRVNGQAVTLAMYQRLGKILVDIHGQHDHQSLLIANTQKQLLDGFCGDELSAAVAEIGKVYLQWQETLKRLDDLEKKARDLAREEEFLQFQVTEIDKAQLSPGEEEELEAARRRLDGAEILLGSVEKVRALLYGNGAAKESAYDSVSQALADIRTMLKYDDSVTPMAETLEQMLYQIEECAAELRHYGEGMTLDPKQVEETENRLQLIRQLKRKYGGSIKEILAFRQEAAASLEELQFKNENKDFLRREAGNMEQHYTKLAQKISDLRHQGGETLAKHLGALWEDLGMEDTKFRVQIDQVLPGPDGRDTIEFIISPNPGEELKPLARIASGGEMSRIMLALKTVLAEIDQVPTLIFDEIDAGIGGETIGRVAEKLAAIGKHRQVLCVTHSPRIAAKARKHFAIKKQIASGRTITNISALKEEQRIAELTRMLGGNDLLTTQHAKNLLKK